MNILKTESSKTVFLIFCSDSLEHVEEVILLDDKLDIKKIVRERFKLVSKANPLVDREDSYSHLQKNIEKCISALIVENIISLPESKNTRFIIVNTKTKKEK